MWDEEDDKKLREAAGSFQPPLDENAWDSMEKLLDEFLPQETDRKRIFFMIPFVLVVVTILLTLWFKSGDLFKNNIASLNPERGNVEKTNNNRRITNNKNGEKEIAQSKGNVTIDRGSSLKKEKNSFLLKNEKIETRLRLKKENKKADKNISNQQTAIPKIKTGNNKREESENITDSKPANNQDFHFANKDKIKASSDADTSLRPNVMKDSNTIAFKTDTSKTIKAGVQKTKTKSSNSFSERFNIGVSAGPGISFVGNLNGKITVDLGLALGYRITKQFGVHTGVFISKKIYAATPNDYYSPGGSSYYLAKIDGDCNVIDIPLNLDIYFSQKRNHEWFASAGLSSYLMKKESYNYFYKLPGGESYVKNQTIFNQNKHYFSVLNLSAGYNYFLNNHFSFSAQPYVELPLTGVGEGKVRLNTAGILFIVKVKPFLKSKK